jgi:hypothetical protein
LAERSRVLDNDDLIVAVDDGGELPHPRIDAGFGIRPGPLAGWGHDPGADGKLDRDENPHRSESVIERMRAFPLATWRWTRRVFSFARSLRSPEA